MLFCVPLALALVTGCKDKEEIKVYRVSKAEPESSAPQNPAPENPAPGGMPAMGGSPSMGAPAGQPLQIAGNPPSNWEPQPLSSMRQASYLVKGEGGATADISLVILGGSAGGVLENINRWLSQLGQPATTEEKLAQMARHVSSPLGEVTVVDLEGLPPGADAAKDGRIVGGIASGEGGTVFFKMRGNAALAEAQKEAFIQWIGSVRMGESVVTPAMSASAPPAPPMAPDAGSEKPQIKWEAPDTWKTVAPSAMRYASFSAAGQDGETADISVSVFGGDGGGDLENVNRWRNQVGLEAVGAGDLKTLVVPVACKDGEILTVDMAGPKEHILAGWARVDGKSWFFKLTGPDRIAAAEKARFAKFLQSIQLHP